MVIKMMVSTILELMVLLEEAIKEEDNLIKKARLQVIKETLVEAMDE